MVHLPVVTPSLNSSILPISFHMKIVCVQRYEFREKLTCNNMLFDASKTSIRKTNKSVYVITVLDCTERPLYVRSEPVVSRQTL